jgi:hypothetical protein
LSRIIVSGVIANKYRNGGAVWTRLSWILGFQRLGFEVTFVEQIGPESCVDERGEATEFLCSVPLEYFKRVTEEFGLTGSSALIYDGGREVYGMTEADLLDLAGEAALLVNISGHLTYEPVMERARCKAWIDVDPGFTQFWHAEGTGGAQVSGHDLYYTVGENIGKPFCAIPAGGIEWRPVRQPVALDLWPVSYEGERQRFTTIASWRGPFGSVWHGGKTYGLKVHEFRKFIELPRRTPYTFELALDIHPAEVNDLELLDRNGWRVVDPKAAVGDPDSFRRYVHGSGAEFSAAQGIYVDTESGWFSDRTTRYLASGKPALVQDTGFSRNLPVGEGLLAFRTLEEAVAGAEEIQSDYETHARAARHIAETVFASDVALRPILEDAGVSP